MISVSLTRTYIYLYAGRVTSPFRMHRGPGIVTAYKGPPETRRRGKSISTPCPRRTDRPRPRVRVPLLDGLGARVVVDAFSPSLISRSRSIVPTKEHRPHDDGLDKNRNGLRHGVSDGLAQLDEKSCFRRDCSSPHGARRTGRRSFRSPLHWMLRWQFQCGAYGAS